MTRTIHVNTGPGRWQQNIAIGAHTLQTDEALSHGGADLGPSAEELLLAALGSCTSTTAQMYAQRKGWHLESVQVDLSFSSKAESESADHNPLRAITLTIAFAGELSPEQCQRLFEIAGRCPIHRLLSAPIPISASYRALTEPTPRK